ncbi:hypothetical protein HOV30_gp238 [Erwinia phage Derbicus]|uniref:Uncharacterized protein n=2 Tax=Derbicusvirus derbicus TaxID=2734104 RepID=A0A482IL89_9CAUD|nr:hypothetical protein BIZ82_gp239 [Erwinia phage vB_EamM_EarlPhillipIV]YP_009821282.1 hypothetical protein HOV30_gp238 [Erwinia phage Derbicus]ANZ49088.1 hypothetical protein EARLPHILLIPIV_239 [Erwinia phage vB_EamM_EarlPhillipIV]QBP07664.1 hypothetical protein DERBICUS_238 [Erwinia phage Derbicus]
MTIALSVGSEHFKLKTAISFKFNPNWMLFNNRANRKAVISKFTDVIEGGDFVIVERTMVVDGDCTSDSFIFEKAFFKKLPVQDFILWDESKQQHKVDGIWRNIGNVSYRLRYILVTTLHRQRIHTQPFAGASYIDSLVMDTVVKELSYTKAMEQLQLTEDQRHALAKKEGCKK